MIKLHERETRGRCVLYHDFINKTVHLMVRTYSPGKNLT